MTLMETHSVIGETEEMNMIGEIDDMIQVIVTPIRGRNICAFVLFCTCRNHDGNRDRPRKHEKRDSNLTQEEVCLIMQITLASCYSS